MLCYPRTGRNARIKRTQTLIATSSSKILRNIAARSRNIPIGRKMRVIIIQDPEMSKGGECLRNYLA